MKYGLLIDPEAKTVTQVDFHGSTPEIYKHLMCNTFELVTLPFSDALLLDEGGLFREPFHCFKLLGFSERFTGRGLVVGTTSDGEFTDPQITQELIDSLISWYDTRFTATIKTQSGEMDHSIFGNISVISNFPVFAEYHDEKNNDDHPEPRDGPEL